MAVIKANAYGHGLIAVARILGNVDALAVARVSEGVRLREAGITNRIVILEGCSDTEEVHGAIAHGMEIVVHDPAHFEILQNITEADALSVWLKLDTGMGRLGFEPSELQPVLERLKKISAIRDDIKLMTHLACADNPDSPKTLEQLRQFGAALDDFGGDISIANSAGILLWPQTLEPSHEFNYRGENWVRPGLALFGASPVLGKSARDMGLLPAMSFESRLIAVKTIRQGETVGYGGDWRAERANASRPAEGIGGSTGCEDAGAATGNARVPHSRAPHRLR